MRSWTVHTRPDAAPVLLREGFSWGALLFGPLWLAAGRAWIAAALALAAWAVAARLGAIPFAAVAVLLGLSGRDLLRWSLEQRGFVLVHVIAARDGDAALVRLLTARPDLTGAFQ